MRSRVCQDLTFFILAVLLLLICGLCSAAQHMDAAAPQMGETSGPQMGGNSPSQTDGTSGFQGGSNYGPQPGDSPGYQSGSGSGSQTDDNIGSYGSGSSGSQTSGSFGSPASGGSGFQAGGTSGALAGIYSESAGKRQRSQMGGANSPLLNASSDLVGSADNASADSAGRKDVDFQNWRGTASKGGESYPVRLNVESILTLDPGVARGMLSSNLSLVEIRSQLSMGNRNAILRGSLRISNDSYRLVNITIKSSANQSVLQAGLASSGTIKGAEAKAGIVGNASLTIYADDLEVARGYAIIDDSSYSGTYEIMLERQSGRGRMWGMQGRES